MFTRIDFEAYYGNETKKVTLASPSGACGGYNILLDNYLQGKLFKRNNAWVAFLNQKDNEFTGADIEVLGEIIDEASQE